jgi:hypothetical protein
MTETTIQEEEVILVEFGLKLDAEAGAHVPAPNLDQAFADEVLNELKDTV